MIDVEVIKKAISDDESIKNAIEKKVSERELNAVLIPKVVKKVYPDLTQDEAESFSKLMIQNPSNPKGEPQVDRRFIRMAGQFVNIDDLHIDLIDKINPFQKAYEILSKSVTTKVLKVIQDAIAQTRIQMTPEEAVILWPKIKDFVQTFKREPNIQSPDAIEKRMAEALIYLKAQKRKISNEQQS